MQLSLLDDFLMKMKEGKTSFSISYPKGKDYYSIEREFYNFSLNEVGNATYIYGGCNCDNKLFFTKISYRPELVAIATADRVYILNESFFFLYERERTMHFLPDNVSSFRAFYKKIQTVKMCSEDEAVLMLCGFIDNPIPEMNVSELEEFEWSRKENVCKEILDNAVCSTEIHDWERNIAHSLNGVYAKELFVEFHFNGINAGGYIESDVLLRKLRENSKFSKYDFATVIHGESILNGLRCTESDELKCCHIKTVKNKKRRIIR